MTVWRCPKCGKTKDDDKFKVFRYVAVTFVWCEKCDVQMSKENNVQTNDTELSS